MRTIHIQFKGPFSWRADTAAEYIFDAPVGEEKGVYIWTLPFPTGRIVYYVGETGRSFALRHWEHLREHMSGFYHLLDPSLLRQGIKRTIWNGMYGVKTRETLQDLFARWRDISPVIDEQSKVIEFFLAPCTEDDDVRREIERALAAHVASTPENFQDAGIRYRGAATAIQQTKVMMRSDQPIVCMPEFLVIGTDDVDNYKSSTFITQ